MVLHPLVVGQVGLLQAPVVGDVLALRVDAVQMDGLALGLGVRIRKYKPIIAEAGAGPLSSDLNRIVAVLVNDALSPLQVFLLGLLLPPVHQVTLAVHLTALVLVSFILVQSEEREDSHQTRG